jgi:DNA polymerase III gamma/tau subunit
MDGIVHANQFFNAIREIISDPNNVSKDLEVPVEVMQRIIAEGNDPSRMNFIVINMFLKSLIEKQSLSERENTVKEIIQAYRDRGLTIDQGIEDVFRAWSIVQVNEKQYEQIKKCFEYFYNV